MDHMGRVGEAGGRRLPWKHTQEEHTDEREGRDETHLHIRTHGNTYNFGYLGHYAEQIHVATYETMWRFSSVASRCIVIAIIRH